MPTRKALYEKSCEAYLRMRREKMKVESTASVLTTTPFLRTIIAASLMLGCHEMAAMPTNEDIENVTPLIEDLTKGDFAAMKAGEKTRAQLAEAMLGYLDDAESEAAKFVLIRQAFRQYMASGDVSKALDTYNLLHECVKNVQEGTLGAWSSPHIDALIRGKKSESIAALLNHSLSGGDTESVTAIFKLVKPHLRKLTAAKSGGAEMADVAARIAGHERRQKDAKNLKLAVRKKPTDVVLREKYGLCLAMMGRWQEALKEFAQTSGKLAEVAVWENTKPDSSPLTPSDVAEFWWEKSESAKDSELAKTLRGHAAGWYQLAIDDGALKGLRKTLAEKRVVEAEKAGNLGVGVFGVKMPINSDKPIKFATGGGVEMELMPCPAGTFEMGYKDGKPEFNLHKVKLTRPFWMSKYPVTRKLWNEFMPSRPMNALEKALGGEEAAMSCITRSEIEDFCKALTRKYRRLLPQNYIFRLPTEAEWEYACRANAKTDEPYGKPFGLRREESAPVLIDNAERREMLKKANVQFDEKKSWLIPGTTVGQRKPNGWGLYDMLGNVESVTYDCIPSVTRDGQPWRAGATPQGMDYSDAVDPLTWTNDPEPVSIVRSATGGGWGVSKRTLLWKQRVSVVGFRIVIGPDLVKEKTAKQHQPVSAP